MTQSPSLPELPKPAIKGSDWNLYDDPFTADQMNAHGLACYEAGRASRAQSEWQPIETAPKDQLGFAILGSADEGWVEQGWWDGERGEWWPVNCHQSDSYGEELRATHWMPLPAPPTQGAEGAAPQAVASERIALLETALSEVLEFQSAPEGPHIFDWGRWRRIRENTPPFQRAAPTPTAPQEADALREALKLAEAALSDIGDADREPGDDLAWCESRAAQDLPAIRAALAQHQPATLGETK